MSAKNAPLHAARWLVAVGAAGVVIAWLIASPVWAASRIIEPGASPYHVVLDAHGAVLPFTVAATGFPPDANVFAEQCDGRIPSDPNWSPTRDCDAGTAPGPVSADAGGTARFDANNPNRRILYFVGPSPQGIFNCLPPGAPDPKNQLRSFSNCQIRVSTNNVQATTDQVFLPIVLGDNVRKSSGSSALPITLAVIGVVVVAGIALALVTRARAVRR